MRVEKNVLFISEINDGVHVKQIYEFNNNQFKLIDTGIATYFVIDDNLFYTKENYYSTNGLLILGTGQINIYYIENGKANIIDHNKISRFSYNLEIGKLYYQIFDSNPVKWNIIDINSKQISTNDANIEPTFNDYEYYQERLLGNIKISTGKNIIRIKNGDNTSYIKIKGNIVLTDNLQSFYKGFLLKSLTNNTLSNLDYIDLENGQLINILNNVPYREVKFDNFGKYLIIIIDEKQSKFWNAETREMVNIKNTNFKYVSYNGAISNDGFYWKFENNYLIQKFKITENTYFLTNINGIYYFTKYIGNNIKIYKIVDNSLVEISTNFAEGFKIKNLFLFNADLYVYVFTPETSWQVWKLGKSEADETNIYKLNSREYPIYEKYSILEKAENKIKYYPNPVDNQLYIEITNPSNYQLINLQGQLQLQGNITNNDKIDVSTLPQGVYLLMLSDGNQRMVKKIIKN